jgi:hypothetical protein
MTGTTHITKAVVEAMEKGDAYVNVHTKRTCPARSAGRSRWRADGP